MTRRIVTIGTVVFLAAGLALAQEKVAMKQTYTPGTYDLSMTIKMDGQTTVTIGTTAQPAMDQKMTINMTAAMTIGEPDKDGVRKASFTYRRIAQSMTAGTNEAAYDSDDPNTASSPMAAPMKPIVGAKISYEIAPDGNIQNVQGLDEMWDAMVKESPGMARTAAEMKKQFGGEQVRGMMMSSSTGYLPANAVAVGEAWKSEIKMNAPVIGAMTLAAACKLAGVEKAQALIDIDSKGGIDKPTEIKTGDTPMTIERMSINQKGRLTFDLARNMICGSKTTGDMSFDMTMDGPGGQKVTASTKQDIQTEVTIVPAKAETTTAPAK